MFFPMFVMGVVAFAAGFTGLLAGVALVFELLRRRHKIPFWPSLIVIFLLASVSSWFFFKGGHPAIPAILGCIATLAFAVHWAAISSTWWLSRYLFNFFRKKTA